jgi:hypothetical protein
MIAAPNQARRRCDPMSPAILSFEGLRSLASGRRLAVGLAVMIFVVGLFGLAANVDLLARRREEAQTLNAIHGRILEVADQLTGNLDWDEALARASNT